jgi:hypothetical protein
MESYRANVPGTKSFNDFDDYNNLFIVYKSNVAGDTARTPGSSYETTVPGIRAKYFVKARVNYVNQNDLNGFTTAKTWHKKITVTVTSPSFKDTLVFPAVMSFWN